MHFPNHIYQPPYLYNINPKYSVGYMPTTSTHSFNIFAPSPIRITSPSHPPIRLLQQLATVCLLKKT